MSDNQQLVGCNVLGCLLTELREVLRRTPQSLGKVDPPPVSRFTLLGTPIATIEG